MYKYRFSELSTTFLPTFDAATVEVIFKGTAIHFLFL